MSCRLLQYPIVFIIVERSGIKGVIVLLPLLGITWIIGIFAVNVQTTVFFWLFTLFNTLQVSNLAFGIFILEICM